jgi:hypothetical protein
VRPIVALLSDFGARDYYVGAMKGAVLSACPEANLADISHELPPHAVEEAALCLVAAQRAFPAGTVFLAVVDPSVGSTRRGLAIEAGGYRFVGPDNGLFTFVLQEHPEARVHELTNAGLFRHRVSAVFHGRDVFAPVAGLLAAGMALETVGPSVPDAVLLELAQARQVRPNEWEAAVVHVDRFGNLTTALDAELLGSILATVGNDPTEIVALVGERQLPLVHAYSEVAVGEACALLGSMGRLELAVNQGSAAVLLGLGLGQRVGVRALHIID